MRILMRSKLRCPATVIALVLGCAVGLVFLPGMAMGAVVARGALTLHTFAVAGELSETVTPYQVTATSSGSAPLSEPMSVTIKLPKGFSASVSEYLRLPAVPNGSHNATFPEPLAPLAVCEVQGSAVEGVSVTCPVHTESGVLAPNEGVEVILAVAAEAGTPSGLHASVSASAPGSPEASVEEPLTVGGAPLTFGPSALVSLIAGADGEVDQQAGDHPSQMTTKIDLKTKFGLGNGLAEGYTSVHDVRDVVDDLPVGLVGDAQATPTCTFAELGSYHHCPLDTRVGQIRTEQAPGESSSAYSPLFNMVPELGVAAEFGFFDVLKTPHVIYADVARTPAGYVVRATSREVPQIGLTSISATIFGDPATNDETDTRGPHLAMFTNSSDCNGESQQSTVHMDSWQEPGVFHSNGTPQGEPEVQGANWASLTSGEWPRGGTVTPATSTPVTGCSLLRFVPSAFSAQPETTSADSPSGLTLDEQLPQNEHIGALGTPPLRDEVVTLPAGMALSPAAADGLVGCQESGPEGINFQSPSAGDCPATSKVGSVEVTTPVLEERLTEGGLFVAEPKCGGPGQPGCTEEMAETGGVFALYLEVSNANRGIHIKLPGKVEVGGNGLYSREHGLAPGQVRTSFLESPQIGVFSDLKIKLNGGPRAPLATPQSCGTFTTNAVLTPWSAPESGPPAVEEPSFGIAGCGNRFAPAFSAGTFNNQAGGYSAFSTTFSRHDGEQDLAGVTVDMPEGLLGKIAGFEQCPEAEANAGTCAAAKPGSHIGTATASAGSGPSPFYQTGNVYLTGPYKGAPFGLSVVVPAKAGPYNLGDIVVRAAIYIDPSTAAARIVSDPLPQSIDGVPLRVQTVNVTVGQANDFTFNATSCAEKTIAATLTGTQGAVANVGSYYQAAGCQGLAFKPGFSASTQANGTRKGRGASLDVKIGYPQPFTAYANIRKVDTSLPLALSSRLTTLQKACTEGQFAVNPAGCPPASAVGVVTAVSPLLANPLRGPAYLVSHGGRAFPDLDIVLQGENGVVIDLTGNTDIKHGITYSKFESAPDAPVSSFELNLPEKENSILAAVKNLCAPTNTVTVKKKVTERVHGRSRQVAKDVKSTVPEPLVMPTSMTAQNGAVITQNIDVAVTGCGKVHKAAVKHKQKHKQHNRRKQA